MVLPRWAAFRELVVASAEWPHLSPEKATKWPKPGLQSASATLFPALRGNAVRLIRTQSALQHGSIAGYHRAHKAHSDGPDATALPHFPHELDINILINVISAHRDYSRCLLKNASDYD